MTKAKQAGQGRQLSFWLNNLELWKLERIAKQSGEKRNAALRRIIREASEPRTRAPG